MLDHLQPFVNKLLLPVTFSTLTIYCFLIVMLRLVGRRTLAQLSALDLVVIILLGSSVETAMVHASTSIKAGFVSATALLVANGLLTKAMRKSKRLRHLVGGGPVLLVHDGVCIEGNMRRLGISHSDIMEAIRARETSCVEDVRFCVLESDGRINVVRRDASRDRNAVPCEP